MACFVLCKGFYYFRRGKSVSTHYFLFVTSEKIYYHCCVDSMRHHLYPVFSRPGDQFDGVFFNQLTQSIV